MRRIDAQALPRLDVRDLQIVLALARARTTARASEMLHLTQPAVSRALLALEAKLGVALFERTPRGLSPTAAGTRLVAKAGALLDAFAELEDEVRGPRKQPLRIRVVCECYTAYHWMPSTLIELRRSIPGLELSLAIEHRADPVGALLNNQVDVALLTTAKVPPRRLHERPLFADEVIFVLSPTHALASRRRLTPEDLGSASLLVSSHTPSSESQWFMRKVFGRARPQLRFERFPLTEALLDVARAGMGVAALSEWIAAPHLERGGLVTRRLATGPLLRPWRLAWRPELDAVAPRLLAALSSTAPRLSATGGRQA